MDALRDPLLAVAVRGTPVLVELGAPNPEPRRPVLIWGHEQRGAVRPPCVAVVPESFTRSDRHVETGALAVVLLTLGLDVWARDEAETWAALRAFAHAAHEAWPGFALEAATVPERSTEPGTDGYLLEAMCTVPLQIRPLDEPVQTPVTMIAISGLIGGF